MNNPENEQEFELYGYDCMGTKKGGLGPGHAIKIVAATDTQALAGHQAIIVGVFPQDMVKEIFPDAINTGSHTICADCKKTLLENYQKINLAKAA